MKKLSNNINVLIYFQDQGSSEYLIDALLNYNFKAHVYLLINTNVKKILSILIKSKNYKNSNYYFLNNKKKLFFSNFIKKNNINFVICTCGSNKIDSSNYNLIISCLELKIKLNIFIDHWKGTDRLNNFKTNSIFFNLGVIDDDQKKIYKKNMKKSNIMVTGHPSLEKINIKFDKRKKSILIVSQPLITKNFDSCFSVKVNSSYLIDNLINYLNHNFKNHKIYYKPHPKENNKMYLKKNIIIDTDNDSCSLYRHDIYVGFDTMYIYKAFLTKAKIIQLAKNFHSFNDFDFKKKYFFNKFTNKIHFNNSEKKCHKFLNKFISFNA